MANKLMSGRQGSDIQAIKELLQEVFTKHLTTLNTGAKTGATRAVFFPNGIELIALKIKAGSSIEFSFVVAGEKAPKIEQLFSSSNAGTEVITHPSLGDGVQTFVP
jgi:hypothetical protein